MSRLPAALLCSLALAAAGFESLGGQGVDHVLGHDLRAAGAAATPDRGALSDHAPVIVAVVASRERGYEG